MLVFKTKTLVLNRYVTLGFEKSIHGNYSENIKATTKYSSYNKFPRLAVLYWPVQICYIHIPLTLIAFR